MKNLYFGTDGIRGTVSTDPLLTPPFLRAVGTALSHWVIEYEDKNPLFIFGMDTRSSCTTLEHFLAQGIIHGGGTCLHAGVIPTPALQSILQNSSYAYGIMLSASHNPATDNGIKLLTEHGKLSPKQEQALSSLIAREYTHRSPTATYAAPPLTPLPSADQRRYVEHLHTFFSSHFLDGITVALDCANGATHTLAPLLFNQFGADVITMGDKPNGCNINEECGSLHPAPLQKLVRKSRADIGVALDGDGDRCVLVTPGGKIKDGDDILALLVDHPIFAQEDTIVGTVMTNYGLERFLEKKGKKLVRTPVGDKYVLAALHAHNAALGGEPSGHTIVAPYLTGADGIFTALLVAHVMLITDNWTLTTFGKYPQAHVTLPVKKKEDLTQEPYARIISEHQAHLTTGRSIVRYSGTESVLRIMIEDESAEAAHAKAQRLATQLKSHLR